MPNAKTLRWGPNATYIPLEMGFALATQRKLNLHTKNEMYMANARNLRHLTQEIPACWYFFHLIGNAKVLSSALGNAKLPDASSFAWQWNIGFNMHLNLKGLRYIYQLSECNILGGPAWRACYLKTQC